MFKTILTQEEVKKRQEIFLSLSQRIREIIFSEQTADKLYNISWGKNKLEPEGQRVVSFTVGEVLLGLIKRNELANTLAKRLEINSAIAEKITQEIDLEILRPVMVYLPKESQGPISKPVSSKPITQPSPSQPKEKIVDLKNLPKE